MKAVETQKHQLFGRDADVEDEWVGAHSTIFGTQQKTADKQRCKNAKDLRIWRRVVLIVGGPSAARTIGLRVGMRADGRRARAHTPNVLSSYRPIPPPFTS